MSRSTGALLRQGATGAAAAPGAESRGGQGLAAGWRCCWRAGWELSGDAAGWVPPVRHSRGALAVVITTPYPVPCGVCVCSHAAPHLRVTSPTRPATLVVVSFLLRCP